MKNPDEQIEKNQLARIEQLESDLKKRLREWEGIPADDYEAFRWLDLLTLEAADRIEQLEAELETEQMRLVACGVVAMANTPESAAKVREMSPKYRSASCDDVALAVDREMALRAERNELLAWLKELYEAMIRYEGDVGGDAPQHHHEMMRSVAKIIAKGEK